MPWIKHCYHCGAPITDHGPRTHPHCDACGQTTWRNSKPTASVLITDARHRVLLVRRAIEPKLGFWDVPGGFLEPGELPEVGAKREALEELGVTVRLTGLQGMYVDTYQDATEFTLNLFYTAQIESGMPQAADDADMIGWFGPNELPKNIAFQCGIEALEVWRTTIGMSRAQYVGTQYSTSESLRIRQETHTKYTVGPALEADVDRVLKLKPHEALLDVGTGPGSFPGRLRAQGHAGRLVGLDFSQGMVDEATRAHPNIEFLQGDAMNLPFAHSSFDVVTARHMLYHVPNIRQALEECKRVLKPSGRFLAATNADGYLREFWQAVRQTLEGETAFETFLREHSDPRFFHGDLVNHVRSVFDDVHFEITDSALEFPNPEPVLQYFDSMRSGWTFSDETWARARNDLHRTLEPHFQTGPMRVTKGVALITASR